MLNQDFEKAEKPEIKLPASTGSLKKQGSSRKTSISALLTMPKNWTMWITIQFSSVAQITINFGKFSSGHGTGKGQFSFESQRKAMPKNAQTTAQLHSSHTLVK